MKTIALRFKEFLMIFLGVLSFNLYAQSPKVWEWAKCIAANGTDKSYGFVTDKSGNTYITGSFKDSMDLGTRKIGSNGYLDVFLLKYNTKGELEWARQAGGTDADEAYGIAIDKSGDVFITGYFSSNAMFSDIQLTSNSDRDFFVAKYNSNGEALWVKKGEGAMDNFGTAITIDNSGNALVTGVFNGSVLWRYKKFKSQSGENIFLIKYNNDGKLIWARTGGGNLSDRPTALICDSRDNCYLVTDYEGNATFDGKRAASRNKSNVLIAKYDIEGNTLWVKRVCFSTGISHASSIALDGSGDIYLAGYFSGITFFANKSLKNLESHDLFLAKLNSNGNLKWVTQTGGTGDQSARSIVLDKKGNIYLAGEYNATFTYDANNIRSLDNWDIYVLKYNSNGKLIDGDMLPGIGYNKASGISIDEYSNIYLAGYFSKSLTVGSTNLFSYNGNFIAKLKSFIIE